MSDLTRKANGKIWTEKHKQIVKETIGTSGKPMDFKSPEKVIHHLEKNKKLPYCPACDENHKPCSVYWVHFARGDYD